MSIKSRLVVIISVLVLIAFVVVGAVTVAETKARMIDRVDATLVQASGKGSHPAPPGAGPEVFAFPSSKRSIATVSFDSRGHLLRSEPSGFNDSPDPLPNLSSLGLNGLLAHLGRPFTATAIGSSGLTYRVLIQMGPDGDLTAVAAPLSDVTSTIRNLVLVIAFTSIAVLAGTVLVVWLVVRHGLQPIDAMIDTARLIARGDLSRRVEYETSSNEVGKLGQALNEMLTQVESSFRAKEQSERKLRQFAADASHELRTPLTSIRGYAELYRAGAVADPETLERAMLRIESESVRMGKLVEDLLLLARLDQGRSLRHDPVDLVQIVENAVADARAVEPDRPISVETPDRIIVTGDADRLKQVIDNLLANVRVHTERALPVRVQAAIGGGDAMVSVTDSGPGIDPSNRDHIFDRFYRLDSARTRERGGTGLGLSIVKSIIEAHGGQVSVESAPGKGATFKFTLPMMTARSGSARVSVTAAGASAMGR